MLPRLNQRKLAGYFSGKIYCQMCFTNTPLCFVRPNELCLAKWKDIDFEKREWHYRVGKQTQIILCRSTLMSINFATITYHDWNQ